MSDTEKINEVKYLIVHLSKNNKMIFGSILLIFGLFFSGCTPEMQYRVNTDDFREKGWLELRETFNGDLSPYVRIRREIMSTPEVSRFVEKHGFPDYYKSPKFGQGYFSSYAYLKESMIYDFDMSYYKMRLIDKYHYSKVKDTLPAKVLEKFIQVEKEQIKNKENIKPKQEKLKIIGTGTGFFISNSGYLLTNEHVISGSSRVSLYINGEIIESEVIMSDSYNDIALLKANIKSNAIPLSESNVNKGASVSAFGYPLLTLQGNELKVTFGNINSLSGIKEDFRFYQIDTPIQPGNSGGPLINKFGEVVAIVSSTLSQDYTLKNSGVLNQNVNYAIKIDYSLPILKQFNVQTQELRNKVKMDTEQLVKKIENSVVIVISQGY